ncbi:MAG: hypothetical protein E7286_01645 [Lachnospiraceae bacterium]|nr:hypothetical protein [Lachnospiraceae bacterium]
MEKMLNWWKTDKRYILALKIVLMGLLPLVACLLYCARQGYGIGDVYLPGSEWNDELFYFKQVEAIVNYGFPQGYFGFNESHALKLSFAAWSPVLVFPWVIWGLLFGWNLLTPIWCNIFLLTLAMVIFVWLVRPTWKQLGILTLLFLLYTPFVRYMLSGMPEIICFSMLIVFYSITISYLRKNTGGKLALLFVLAGLMTLMRPYLLLFLVLPAVLCVVKYKWKGLFGSAAIVGVVLGIYALIKHYLGAEYFAPLFFTDWVTAFFEQGLFGGLRYFCSKLYWNGLAFLQHMKGGLLAGLASGAFFWGYLAVAAVLILQSVIDFRNMRKCGVIGKLRFCRKSAVSEEQKDRTQEMQRSAEDNDCLALFIVELHLAFSFVGMLFALLLMYKLTEGSKHLLTFMAVGVFIISLMKTKFYKKPAFIGLVFAYFYIFMALDPYDYQVPFAEDARVAQVEYWQEIYAENLQMTDEDVPNYENAIIWVFSDSVEAANVASGSTNQTEGKAQSINTKWQLLYGLPEGFGISCCMPDFVMEHLEELQCRYLGTVAGGEIDERCAETGWTEIARDEDLVVYENVK